MEGGSTTFSWVFIDVTSTKADQPISIYVFHFLWVVGLWQHAVLLILICSQHCSYDFGGNIVSSCSSLLDEDDFGDDGGGGVAVAAAAVAEVGRGGAGVGDGAAHDVQQGRNHTLQELQMLMTEINFLTEIRFIR